MLARCQHLYQCPSYYPQGLLTINISFKAEYVQGKSRDIQKCTVVNAQLLAVGGQQLEVATGSALQ